MQISEGLKWVVGTAITLIIAISAYAHRVRQSEKDDAETRRRIHERINEMSTKDDTEKMETRIMARMDKIEANASREHKEMRDLITNALTKKRR